jgi:hypothetical protein
MFGLFDIVVQEYDYLEDVVFGLFDIVVQEYDYTTISNNTNTTSSK